MIARRQTRPIFSERTNSDSVYVCGDHCAGASIEGAGVSGIRTAEAILETGTRQSAAVHQTGMTQRNRREREKND